MDKRILAKALMECGCVRTGTYRLSSGKLSPYYLDLRRIPSFPEVFARVGEAYVELLRREGVSFDRILGVPTAGIPLGVLLAYLLKKPFLYLRAESKRHGTKRMLEGELREGEKVLLLDDVATTGRSLAWAAEVAKGEGARVEEAVVLVDREEGAGELLREKGIRLLAVMTARELLGELHGSGSLARDEYLRILEYMEGKHV